MNDLQRIEVFASLARIPVGAVLLLLARGDLRYVRLAGVRYVCIARAVA